MSRLSITCAAVLVGSMSTASALAEDRLLHEFERQRLTDVYYSEGISAGDLNGDGHADVVHGPYWFEGPEFTVKREIHPAKPQDRSRYADNFFSWVHDVDGDGANDVFVVGFPGTPAHVYRNPGKEKLDSLWERHEVFDWVSNESPWFTDLVGDETPELVCTRDGRFGYATIDPAKPLEPWTFHAISGDVTAKKFGHGLGVGDVDGDGRADVLHANGWYRQPETLDGGEWPHHPASFTNAYGGAEMHVEDVDGDGDGDVITSLAAHDFGLAWYEQVRESDEIAFRMHRIVGSRESHNRYGVLFSEPHSVTMADVDGDGLADIVTGKTYYSHHEQSPLWDAGAVVYWFRLVRTKDEDGKSAVDWVPHLVDGDAGIGRQVRVQDVTGDGLPDVIVGGMKGAHVLRHRTQTVDEATWAAAQPKVVYPEAGANSPIDSSTGSVPGAIEGEDLVVVEATAGEARPQSMAGFASDEWSGNSQLFWTGGESGAKLRLAFEVPIAGEYEIEARFTKARDYGIVQPHLDGRAVGEPIDGYDPNVVATEPLDLGKHQLDAGRHELVLEITGTNPKAVAKHMVGLDYLRVLDAQGEPVGRAAK